MRQRTIQISCLFILVFSSNIYTVNAAEKSTEANKASAINDRNLSRPFTGKDIIRRCGVKNPGNDQVATFTVTLRDPGGNVKPSVYQRYWKAYHGENGIVDKMLLFTELPEDAKGSAFMRVSYTRESNRIADQWVYLPVLRKIRRVTIRDSGDSFLNSQLTYADVSERAIDDDEHEYLGVRKVKDLEFYVVESTPKETDRKYSKRILWFVKTPDWDNCANVRIDYYDQQGVLLKEQFITWQRLNDAWVWDKVLVRNLQTAYMSVFQLSNVRINTGIKDDFFSDKTIRMGPDAIKPGTVE